MFKKIFISIVIAILAIHVKADPLPAGVKLNLNDFELDLTETVVTHFYLNRDGFKKVVFNSLTRRLSEAGVLADVNNASDVNLDVYVDYLRRFPGDQTPFPSSSLAAPNFHINTKISSKSQVFFQEQSAEMTIFGGSLFGSATNKDIANDIGFLIGLTNTIIGKIVLAYPSAKINPLASDDEKQKIAAEYYALLNSVSLGKSIDYIPDSVSDEYIKRLQSADFKSRIVAYQDIGRDWINSRKLFDFIKNEVSLKYNVEGDSDNTKEVREAMNALASSGLIEYSDFFKEIKSNAMDKKIADQVEDSEKILFRRAVQGSIIHSEVAVNPQESWKVNQLARTVLFSEPKLREGAAKNIYLNFIGNTYLLDTLASLLEKEAFKSNYATGMNANFHEWICRILGDSKDKKYLDLLNRAQKDARVESVRKYAVKYYKVLSKN